MAYFSQVGSLHSGGPITAIVCDMCAQETVPWEVRGTAHILCADRPPPLTTIWRQASPWKWAPYYGANAICRDCGKPA